MSRFIIIVLDGFGIGAMEDVSVVRPADIGANTCQHILDIIPDLKLPALESLGLMNALGKSTMMMKPSATAVFGKSRLMHDGADTFFGHQEIMGTRPSKPFGEPIKNKLEAIASTLTHNGFEVRYEKGKLQKYLVVDNAVTVADNIECDLGQAFNVTAALDYINFEKAVKIGKLVRDLSQVPRVITFGGRGIDLNNLLNAVEEYGDYIGINAPRSGVYNNDYHCIHMGYGVDPTVQLPTLLGKADIPVYLLGKAADVIQNPYGISVSIVATEQVLKYTADILKNEEDAFICANVQETDLCGHRMRADKYAEILKIADSGIAKLLELLHDNDILVVMADHGNDPTIGHPHHTRECVPLLFAGKHLIPGYIGERETLSDIAATVSAFFGIDAPQNGKLIYELLNSRR